MSRPSLERRKKAFAEAHSRAYDSIKKFSKKPVGIVYANGDMQALSPDDEHAWEMAEYEIRYSFFEAITEGKLPWYESASSIIGENKIVTDRTDMSKHIDWVGVNYYSRDVVSSDNAAWKIVNGFGYASSGADKSLDGRSVSDTGWEVYPEGIYNLVMSYNRHLGLPMMVTENGVADDSDRIRPRYITSHLKNLERAIHDGANVDGYMHWALTDNYEWASGFSKRFGLLRVDFETKKRYICPSALVLKHIVENRGVTEELDWIAADRF